MLCFLRRKQNSLCRGLVLAHRPFAVKSAFEGAVARVLGKNLLLCGGKVVSLQPEIYI